MKNIKIDDFYSTLSCNRTFYILLRYSKSSIFEKIYKFLCLSGNYGCGSCDFSYILYSIFLRQAFIKNTYTKSSDEAQIMLKNLLTIIDVITSQYSYNFYGENEFQLCEKIERFVNLAIEVASKTGKFLYWEYDSRVHGYLIYYIDIKDVKDLLNIKLTASNWNTSKAIIENKYSLFIVDSNIILNYYKDLYDYDKEEDPKEDVLYKYGTKVNRIRRLEYQPKLDRFLTIYRCLAEILGQMNEQKEYCPWCNPDKSLIKSGERPRIKDDCKKIRYFIAKYAHYSEETMNNIISALKREHNKKSPSEIRKLIGLKLQSIVDSANNELIRNNAELTEEYTTNYTSIRKLIKTRYQI